MPADLARRLLPVIVAATALVAASIAAGAVSASADALPTVTGVSPTTTDYRATETATLTGTGFADGDHVRLVDVHNSNWPATHIHVDSPTQLTFTVPAQAPGHYDVRVSSAAGSSAVTAQDQITLTNIVTGSPWQPSVPPLPADAGSPRHNDQMQDVSCSDTDDCAAWGYYYNDKNRLKRMLASSAGGTWTSVRADMPADTGKLHTVELSSASCGAVGKCVVVGRYRRAHVGTEGFIERLANGSWHADTIPVPDGQPVNDRLILRSASCAGTVCVAVGDSERRPTISTRSDGVWTTIFAPLPSFADGTGHLYSISCPTATYCVTVGLYNRAGARYLVDTLSDGTWTAGVLPLPADAGDDQIYHHRIQAVSCGSVGFCTAVGQYRLLPHGGRSMMVTLDSGTWTATEANDPNTDPNFHPKEVKLQQVSCAPSDTCVAIQPSQWPMTVETLTGGVWTGSSVTLPDDATGAFYDTETVSCYAAGHCRIAGTYATEPDSAGVVDPMFPSYTDGTWSAAAAAMPDPLDSFAVLFGLWCGSGGGCVATGVAHPGSSGGASVIETLPDN